MKHTPFGAERIARTSAELIGSTPLLELTRTGSGARLLLKLENFNPTGSCKVRMAREMILAAEREGKLKPGGRIVEPTSGNTGLGLALAAIERGYRFTAVVDGHATRDKLRAMQAMGAELVFVEGQGDKPSTIERRRIAGEIARTTGAFWPDQHHNPNNNRGYAGLAAELLRDLETDVDYLVGAVGTGGTLCGTVAELRRLGSRVTSIGVEPVGSIIFGGPPGPYRQTGAGAPGGFEVGPNVDHSLIDEGLTVTDIDAFTAARVVARRTGLLLGGTAGAAIHVALRRLALVEPGSTVVVLACDAGEKYLDTVFDDAWLRERHLLNEPAHQRLHRLFMAFDDSRRLVSQPLRAAVG
ncbi:PLP-dependent cysteine synthase family protein [Methylobacterium sp. E-045]|uniref:PLP-dependent cysteine synthase family protein n=1 Tax=Methylobacterium sp. E-045 TaxID=2836575 RepID=UPI001FBA1D5D|nr:cysteine synthase family protein [Methylobacterium sp. E-045]MCJ2131711.1 cysteine synthase family protein [Methylobacterium sp. E-045]